MCPSRRRQLEGANVTEQQTTEEPELPAEDETVVVVEDDEEGEPEVEEPVEEK